MNERGDAKQRGEYRRERPLDRVGDRMEAWLGWGGSDWGGVGGGVKRNREDSQPAAILHVQVYTMCLYAMYMHHSPVWAGRGNG